MIFTFCCVILHGVKGDITSEDRHSYVCRLSTVHMRRYIGNLQLGIARDDAPGQIGARGDAAFLNGFIFIKERYFHHLC